MSENVILLTGFGPFGDHKINASWEAVKLLHDRNVKDYKIISEEIPVTYQYIEDRIPKLWKLHKPVLVIHVGVSKLAKEITLESQAHRTGYEQKDCIGCCHPTKNACEDGGDCIKTELNLKDICKELKCNDTKSIISENAGRYLCEYIYYKSLNIDSKRTLFIHVPILNEQYSAESLSEGIFRVIEIALKQFETRKTS